MKSSVSGTKARRPPSSTCTKTRRFPPRLVVPHCLDRDLVRDPRGSPSPEAVLFLEEALNLLGGHSAIPADCLAKDRSSFVRVHHVRCVKSAPAYWGRHATLATRLAEFGGRGRVKRLN